MMEPGAAMSEGIAEEALHLAERMQQLAVAAAAVALANSRPPPAKHSIGVCTDMGGEQLREWQEAGTLLAMAELANEQLLAQIANSRERQAAAEASRREAEIGSERWAEETCLMAEAVPALSEALASECGARGRIEAEAWDEVAELKKVAAAHHEASKEEAVEHECRVAVLRREVSEMEAEMRRAQEDTKESGSAAAWRTAAVAAAEVREAVDEAESRGEGLEEDRVRLQEELGTLRFSLKDMKSFQHRRLHELDSQVKRFERLRRKLEDEHAQRVRSEEATEAAEAASNESQLRRLHELNEMFKMQVQEAQQDEEMKQHQAAELRLEREKVESEQSLEFARAQERLNALSDVEGSLRRETRTLRNQATQLHRNVDTLSKTASQTNLQLEEAEAALGKLREEEVETGRRAEILRWKLQVTESQLSMHHHHHHRGARGSRAAAAAAAAGGNGGSLAGAGGVLAGANAGSGAGLSAGASLGAWPPGGTSGAETSANGAAAAIRDAFGFADFSTERAEENGDDLESARALQAAEDTAASIMSAAGQQPEPPP